MTRALRRRTGVFAVAGSLIASSLLAAPSAASELGPVCAPERIDIALDADGARVASFSLEIADEPAERAQGLMNRTDLAMDAGMLFLFEEARPVTFWMKDTPLSLDMLFFGPDGRLCGLIERATPFTLDPRPSGCDALAVLEIHGGLAENLEIEVGDAARHPAFGDGAVWSCAPGAPPLGG